MKKIDNYINGKITKSSSKYLPVYDPSKGEKISDIFCLFGCDHDRRIMDSIAGELANGSVILRYGNYWIC